MIKITHNNRFTVTDKETGSYIEVTHCPSFNVTVYGIGANAQITDESQFNDIEELDLYIEMMAKASIELKRLRKEAE